MVNGGTAFITTVINAPAVDHIFLFSTVQEVLDMVKMAGFRICDYMCAAVGGITVEKAEKKHKYCTFMCERITFGIKWKSGGFKGEGCLDEYYDNGCTG